MQLLYTKDVKGDRNNTNNPPTPSNGPLQVQPCHPIPAYFDKYYWTHGHIIHKDVNFNLKSPGHKVKATMDINMDRSNYGCTE